MIAAATARFDIARFGADAVTVLLNEGGGVLRAARAYEPSIRTGAAQEETRWALYRSWVRWRLNGPKYREFQVPERSGAQRAPAAPKVNLFRREAIEALHGTGSAGDRLALPRPSAYGWSISTMTGSSAPFGP